MKKPGILNVDRGQLRDIVNKGFTEVRKVFSPSISNVYSKFMNRILPFALSFTLLSTPVLSERLEKKDEEDRDDKKYSLILDVSPSDNFVYAFERNLNDEEIFQFSNALENNKSPLNKKRIAGEVLSGVAGGIVFAGYFLFTGAAIGANLASEDAPWGGLAEALVGTLIGGIIGYPLGSAAGVYLAGNIGSNETGSFSKTLLGSVVGMVVGSFYTVILAGTYKVEKVYAAIPLVIGAPIGATIAFNMTRRYKSPAGSALIDYKDSKMFLAIPQIYVRPDPFGGKTPSKHIDLVRMDF